MEGELLADQPLGQKLIKKGFWLYFFTILIAPIGYFTRVIISNGLSVSDVGVFYSIVSLITLLSMYHDLGLTEALQYFLPKYWIEKKYNHYKTIVYLTIVSQVFFGILIAGLLYRGADWISIHHFKTPEIGKILRLFCRYFIGINFIQLFTSIFKAFQDVVRQNLTELSRVISIFAFTLIFRSTHQLTLYSISIAWIIGVGIGLIISGIIFISKYKKPFTQGKITIDRKLISRQFKYAFRVFLGMNVSGLLGQVDQQIIINILGPEQAGYYANFFSLFLFYTIIIGPLLGFIFPLVTELIAKKQYEKLSQLRTVFYKYFTIFALSIGGLFFAFGPELATIFFGTKFLYSGQLIMWIAPFLVINVLSRIDFGILPGLGKAKERSLISLMALIVNVVINIFCLYVLKTGLIGAIIALISSRIVLLIGSRRYINTYGKVSFDTIFFIKNFIIICILSVLFFIYKGHFFVIDNTYRYHNILYLVSGVIIYYIIIAGANKKSIQYLLQEIKDIKK